MELPGTTWWIALGCALCALLGAWAALRLHALRERRRAAARNARGRRGERAAERVLAAHGYHVRARQTPLRYAIDVGGAARTVELVADLIVERNGERLIAEVKTGSTATRVAHPDTRRQLLEYQLATATPRVLLVDPDAQSITEVAFPIAHLRAPQLAHGPRRSRAWLVALLLACAWLALQLR